MEAMSGECLCIVSDLPAYKGIMKNNENCLVVSDLEIEKADYIEKVLQLDTPSILKQNKTFADSYADIEKNKEKFISTAERLVYSK